MDKPKSSFLEKPNKIKKKNHVIRIIFQKQKNKENILNKTSM